MKIAGLILIAFVMGCGGSSFEGEPLAQSQASVETWLVVGQSNTVRHKWFQENQNVEAYDYEVGEYAPLSEIYSELAGHFGNELARLSGEPVRIIAGGISGTDINCWQVGGVCFEEKVRTIFESQSISGVLWWQGEQDYSDGTPDYGNRLVTLIESWRTFQDTPWLVVELERFDPCVDPDFEDENCGEPEAWTAIRDEQREALALDHVSIVETLDITNGEQHPTYAYQAIGEMAASAAMEQ